MFEQMKNFKDLAGMLGNMGQMREKMEQIQSELAQKTVEAEAGAGAVRVTANGRLQVVHVQLDPAMLAAFTGESADTDREMVEELIVSATNAALEKAQQLVQDEMGKLAGGMDIPGLENLLGGGPSGPGNP